MPDVDFIIDIAGRYEATKIEDGVTATIFLNEACSFRLQLFADLRPGPGRCDVHSCRLGLFVTVQDLGSRCTVFMNNPVKQAQRRRARNISAGPVHQRIKNAPYKVIRASSPEELGRKRSWCRAVPFISKPCPRL